MWIRFLWLAFRSHKVMLVGIEIPQLKDPLQAPAMGSPTLSTYMLSSTSFSSVISNSSKFPLQNPITNTPLLKPTTHHLIRPLIPKPRAAPGETDQTTTTPLLIQEEEQPNKQVTESVKLLKNAAKTRRVVTEEVLSALSVIEKTKLDSSGFLETLGGSKSPGRTWMLIFTAEKGLERGKYFPITAVQRFDAAAKRIENGVFLGPLGWLTFEGRFSWKKRILAFIFERIRIKVGPFNPFDINFKGRDESEPSSKNPFFIWFYVDEEIAVARGRSGGTAFWCRCQRITSF